MPVLDVEQLKKNKGERIHITCREQLPSLPVEGEEIKPVGEAEYQLTLTNVDNAIAIEGVIKVDLQVTCNRCLGNFTYPLESSFQEVYYDRHLPPAGGKETEWIPYTGDHIDIMTESLQSITVDLPMRFLCKEDCRGLCPVCGTDLNKEQCACIRDEPDPRLAKLKDLLN